MKIVDFEKDVFQALAKLSVPIPEEIIEQEWHNFKRYYKIDGFSLIVEGDFGNRTTLANAIKKGDMFFEIINELLKNISLKLEVHNRESERLNWRYVRFNVVDDHWTYIENQNFRYNAIHDFRKLYFEYHIRFLSELFSIDRARKLVVKYSNLINKWYPDNHWTFNEEILEFVEISPSKEVDEKGKEHPQKDEIVNR